MKKSVKRNALNYLIAVTYPTVLYPIREEKIGTDLKKNTKFLF